MNLHICQNQKSLLSFLFWIQPILNPARPLCSLYHAWRGVLALPNTYSLIRLFKTPPCLTIRWRWVWCPRLSCLEFAQPFYGGNNNSRWLSPKCAKCYKWWENGNSPLVRGKRLPEAWSQEFESVTEVLYVSPPPTLNTITNKVTESLWVQTTTLLSWKYLFDSTHGPKKIKWNNQLVLFVIEERLPKCKYKLVQTVSALVT